MWHIWSLNQNVVKTVCLEIDSSRSATNHTKLFIIELGNGYSSQKIKVFDVWRCSQDRLEKVFSQIRSKGVCNPKSFKFRIALNTSRHFNYEDDAPQQLDFVTEKTNYISTREVKAVIFQPLPQTKNEKTTVDFISTKFVIYYNQKV